MRGRRHSLDTRNTAVRELSLEPPPGSKYELNEIAWDVRTLQMLIRQMLGRAGVSTADLVSPMSECEASL